jgi:ribulose 1,5-bisphosphate carboxylase large subunit-like protein
LTNRITRSSSPQSWADDEAVRDFGERFDLAVDFGGADAHPAGIERGVGAAEHAHAAVLVTR